MISVIGFIRSKFSLSSDHDICHLVIWVITEKNILYKFHRKAHVCYSYEKLQKNIIHSIYLFH